MKKKMITLLLAGTLCLTTIACGSQADNGQSATEPTDTASQQTDADNNTEDKKDSQEEASGGEDVTIEFLYYADDTQKAIIESACAAYEENHPGIKIKQTVVPADGSITTTIATLASSNDLPDISYMAEADVIKYADAGVLYSLDDAIADGTIGEKLDSVTIRGLDGKIYGIGLSNQLIFMYYNKDIFDEYQIAYPSTSVEDAWEWDEFVDIAKKLTVDVNGNHPGDAGFDAAQTKQYGIAFNSMYQFQYMWAAYANGGGIVSADGTQLLWDKAESIEGIQKIADLFYKDQVAPAATSSLVSSIGSADKAMISGDVAMYINGSWDLSNVINANKEAGVNYGVAVLPKMDKAMTMNCGGPAVMFNTTEHPEEVLEFYSYMMNPERVVDILKTGAWLPNEAAWYTDEDKIAQWTSGENVTEEAKEVILSYTNTEGAIAQWPVYYVPGWGDMMSVSDSVMDSVWNGNSTVEEALGQVMDEIKAEFAK